MIWYKHDRCFRFDQPDDTDTLLEDTGSADILRFAYFQEITLECASVFHCSFHPENNYTEHHIHELIELVWHRLTIWLFLFVLFLERFKISNEL